MGLPLIFQPQDLNQWHELYILHNPNMNRTQSQIYHLLFSITKETKSFIFLVHVLFSFVGPLQIYNYMLVIQTCTIDMQIYIERLNPYANGKFHNIFLSQISLLIIKNCTQYDFIRKQATGRYLQSQWSIGYITLL